MASLKRIFQLVGPLGVGKTTVTRLLAGALTEANPDSALLLIDVTDDQQLAASLSEGETLPTLASILVGLVESTPSATQLAKAQSTREGMDWALSETVVAVSDSIDLLACGQLPDVLSPERRVLLVYGLNRLMDAYDFVVVDGSHPLLDQVLFDREVFRRIVVASPQKPLWQQDHLVQTPALILNQTPEGPTPESIQQSLGPLMRDGDLKLVGKLPPCSAPTEGTSQLLQQLAPIFKDCLFRLDLPRTGACS